MHKHQELNGKSQNEDVQVYVEQIDKLKIYLNDLTKENEALKNKIEEKEQNLVDSAMKPEETKLEPT